MIDFMEIFAEKISKYPMVKISKFLRESKFLETNLELTDEGKIILKPSDGIVCINDKIYTTLESPEEIQDFIISCISSYGMDDDVQEAYEHLIHSEREEK